MTKADALEYMRENNDLSTACLEPMGFSFEQWLVFAQFDEEERTKIINKILEYNNVKTKN